MRRNSNGQNGQKEERKEGENFMNESYRDISMENRPIRESSILPIEPIMESINELQNIYQQENIKKQEITPYLNEKIQKFRKKTNHFTYSLTETLSFIFLCCGKEKEKDRIVNFFYRKITKKFNIFYYLHQLKTLRIMRNQMIKGEQISMIKLIASKEYYVCKKEQEKGLSDEEKNVKVLNYFMNNYNLKKVTSEQKTFNLFIENNNN